MGDRIAGLLDILDELAATLDIAVNTTGWPVQVSARRRFSPTPPALDMWPGNAGEQRDTATTGFQETAGTLLVTVRARVAAADHEAQQDLLYAFCDPADPCCVVDALMDDQTLGGLAASVEVLGPSEPTIYQDVAGQTPLLGVQWRVEILEAMS